MKFILMVAALISLIGCSDSNKLSCYNDRLTTYKKEKLYVQLIKSAKKEIPLLNDEHGQNLFKVPSYIDSAMIDDAVFFNQDKNKCLLFILQQTSNKLYLDQVLIIHGSYIKGEWEFMIDRLPAVPTIIYTVRKSGSRDHPIENSFKTLSEKARLFVLTAGTVGNYGCSIDNMYWFGDQNQ
ncbi:hypothetical protein [Mucilaginibacter sp. OK098]|uniref:hypothetical protein n=1 Tax=Mucilaginibacter sp. OK098 TaxID=1855297 RepID=UPI0009149F8E|nr:hypothetical protein [Mucilaginibacter sp. OK098]SHM49537.1 hypothetical protein SAMN05216524_102294 [Mucilaginibacter sp. OK098]